MSIFGTAYPTISSPVLRGLALHSGDGGDLPEGGVVIREPDKPIRDLKINKSQITGEKHFHYKGKHIEFGLKLLNIDNNIISTLMLMEGTEVWYWPHTDDYLRKFVCYMTEVTPFYYDNLVSCDAVVIKMETKNYWQETDATILDASGDNPIGAYEGYLVDESDNYIVDELGNKIIINQINREI